MADHFIIHILGGNTFFCASTTARLTPEVVKRTTLGHAYGTGCHGQRWHLARKEWFIRVHQNGAGGGGGGPPFGRMAGVLERKLPHAPVGNHDLSETRKIGQKMTPVILSSGK